MTEQGENLQSESTRTRFSRVHPLSEAPRDQMVLLVIGGNEVWPGFYDHPSDKWVWIDSTDPEEVEGGRAMIEPNSFVDGNQPDGWMPLPEPPTDT